MSDIQFEKVQDKGNEKITRVYIKDDKTGVATNCAFVVVQESSDYILFSKFTGREGYLVTGTSVDDALEKAKKILQAMETANIPIYASL